MQIDQEIIPIINVFYRNEIAFITAEKNYRICTMNKMKQSWSSWLFKYFFNFFPAYRGTGARVEGISHDWKTVKIRLPLNWRTRNYVGTIFGGSLYASVDPMYMLMLIKILGNEYVVWDKAATIQFRKPGRTTLYATFIIDDREIETIKLLLENERAIDRHYQIDLVDNDGIVHASVEKVIYLRKKNPN